MSEKQPNFAEAWSQVPHYRESERTYQVDINARLATDIFSQALDHLVIACVDLVFTDQNHMLLAKRRTYPQKSWWVIGGRIIAGESPLQAAQRKTEQEAGLKISEDRYRYIGIYSTCFAHRQQAPQNRGLHSLNITYEVPIDKTEKAQICLDSTEYDSWQWCTHAEALSQIDPTQGMNQALLDLLQRVHQQHELSG